MALSADQVEELRRQLSVRRGELREELLAEQGDEGGEGDHVVRHGGEEYFETLLKDVGGGISDIRVQELRSIDEAMARIEGSGYGTCIDCGEEIGYERLSAYPMAKRCLECKQTFEHQKAD